MMLLHKLALFCFFPSLVLSQQQDLIARLGGLGLDGFARYLATNNPGLVANIGQRMDITVWAPSNARVAALISAQTKRSGKSESDTAAQISKTPPAPDDSIPNKHKRQVGGGPPGYPATNYETIFTYLDDPVYVNLGPGQPTRFVKNFASPLDGQSNSLSRIQVVSGLGNTQSTLRGPYKFSNGVIYEVDEFFTLPQPFTQTCKAINLAQKFYDKVVSTGNLPLFENTPAVTIFAPIDSYYSNVTSYDNYTIYNTDPQSYIITGKLALYFSQELIPGRTLVARSGAQIKISFAANGERLVNCRRLLKANVPIKNGLIHFIDGPLYGGCGVLHDTGVQRPQNATSMGESIRVHDSTFVGALAATFGAVLLSFYVW